MLDRCGRLKRQQVVRTVFRYREWLLAMRLEALVEQSVAQTGSADHIMRAARCLKQGGHDKQTWNDDIVTVLRQPVHFLPLDGGKSGQPSGQLFHLRTANFVIMGYRKGVLDLALIDLA